MPGTRAFVPLIYQLTRCGEHNCFGTDVLPEIALATRKLRSTRLTILAREFAITLAIATHMRLGVLVKYRDASTHTRG